MPQPFIETLPLQIKPAVAFSKQSSLRRLRRLICGGNRVKTKTRLILAITGELFLQRRQFCKRRIGIDRTIAVAWARAGRVLPVRRAAIALVAAALVTPAEIAALVASATVAITLVAVALVAIAAEFLRTTAAVLVLVAAILVSLAFKAFTRRTAVRTRDLDGRTLGRRRCIGLSGRALAGLSEFIVAAAAA